MKCLLPRGRLVRLWLAEMLFVASVVLPQSPGTIRCDAGCLGSPERSLGMLAAFGCLNFPQGSLLPRLCLGYPHGLGTVLL